MVKVWCSGCDWLRGCVVLMGDCFEVIWVFWCLIFCVIGWVFGVVYGSCCVVCCLRVCGFGVEWISGCCVWGLVWSCVLFCVFCWFCFWRFVDCVWCICWWSGRGRCWSVGNGVFCGSFSSDCRGVLVRWCWLFLWWVGCLGRWWLVWWCWVVCERGVLWRDVLGRFCFICIFGRLLGSDCRCGWFSCLGCLWVFCCGLYGCGYFVF